MIALYDCGSGGFLYWDVFDETAQGNWKLSWKPSADLTGFAGGTLTTSTKNLGDLLLTDPIYRKTDQGLLIDPMCCPTGGTKSYTLRWIRNRFVVISSTQQRPPLHVTQQALQDIVHGVVCRMHDDALRARAQAISPISDDQIIEGFAVLVANATGISKSQAKQMIEANNKHFDTVNCAWDTVVSGGALETAALCLEASRLEGTDCGATTDTYDSETLHYMGILMSGGAEAR